MSVSLAGAPKPPRRPANSAPWAAFFLRFAMDALAAVVGEGTSCSSLARLLDFDLCARVALRTFALCCLSSALLLLRMCS